MRYLKFFENFDDNEVVISTLKDILSCVKTNKPLSSKLNGAKIMDIHDQCSDEKVMSYLIKVADVTLEEASGKVVDLKSKFDVNDLDALIKMLEANPQKSGTSMKVTESYNKSIKLTDEEMDLFSEESSLQELISKNKITLKNGEVLFDENDMETKEILDIYLEIPGKVEESIKSLRIINKFNQFLNENIELSNSSARIYLDSDEVDYFRTDPVLQKLVTDRKVSLLPPELWFEEEDKNTIDILKRYFPDVDFEDDFEDEHYSGEDEDDSEDFDDY